MGVPQTFLTKIANRLGLTQPAVSIAARRGEEIARQKGYSLLEN
jgi:predicted transcriptional regulator